MINYNLIMRDHFGKEMVIGKVICNDNNDVIQIMFDRPIKMSFGATMKIKQSTVRGTINVGLIKYFEIT